DPLLQLALGDALRVAQTVVGVAGRDELFHGPVDFAGSEARQTRVGLHGREVARHAGATAERRLIPPPGAGGGGLAGTLRGLRSGGLVGSIARRSPREGRCAGCAGAVLTGGSLAGASLTSRLSGLGVRETGVAAVRLLDGARHVRLRA